MSLLEGGVFSEHINPKALKFNKRSLLVREFQNCDTLNYLVQTEMLRGGCHFNIIQICVTSKYTEGVCLI